jgi:hypothetical protein
MHGIHIEHARAMTRLPWRFVDRLTSFISRLTSATNDRRKIFVFNPCFEKKTLHQFTAERVKHCIV